jgi:cytochrome c oxidase subunit II
VKLIMTAEDVLHSFFIPNFRVKQDVVPGMYTTVWFEAKIPGKHQIYCTEYCGTDHSGMLAMAYVLNAEQWELWKRGKKIQLADDGSLIPETEVIATSRAAPTRLEPVSLVDQGKQLAQSRGCVSCHSADGSKNIGPSFKALYGSQVMLAGGGKATADDNYLRKSITDPASQVVEGYNAVMPTFRGQINEIEMNSLIAYIKSLKN